MSIQPLGSTSTQAKSRRTASGQAAPSGPSFQDRLAQTTAKTGSVQTKAAADKRTVFDRSSLAENSLLSSLSDLKTTLLARMKEGKEKEEEQEAWDKLMEYVDAWIESLREGSDIEKISRAHAALQASLDDAGTERQDLGSYLLAQLTECISV